jgi:hypothetical protein
MLMSMSMDLSGMGKERGISYLFLGFSLRRIGRNDYGLV